MRARRRHEDGAVVADAHLDALGRGALEEAPDQIEFTHAGDCRHVDIRNDPARLAVA